LQSHNKVRFLSKRKKCLIFPHLRTAKKKLQENFQFSSEILWRKSFVYLLAAFSSLVRLFLEDNFSKVVRRSASEEKMAANFLI